MCFNAPCIRELQWQWLSWLIHYGILQTLYVLNLFSFSFPFLNCHSIQCFLFFQKDFDLGVCLLPTGNWPLLPGGRWHPGGPDDPAQAIRACHCCLQAQHRQVGGRPSADSGISGVWQQTHQLHHGGTGQWQYFTFFFVWQWNLA